MCIRDSARLGLEGRRGRAVGVDDRQRQDGERALDIGQRGGNGIGVEGGADEHEHALAGQGPDPDLLAAFEGDLDIGGDDAGSRHRVLTLGRAAREGVVLSLIHI